MTRTVAVTGGTGFIGANLVDALVRAGHRVRVLDTRAPERDDVEFHEVDILDLVGLQRAVKGTDFTFHLAAMADVNDIFEDPARAVQVNVSGTANVLEAARLTESGRVVLASTVWVYGATTEDLVDEHTPLSPDTDRHLYVTTKIASEFACRDFATLYGRPYTVLRCGIPYGPHMRETTVMSAFFRRALAGDPLAIDGDGTQSRNFVYVEDLCRGYLAAMSPLAENRVFNLDGPGPVTIRRVAEITAELVGDVEVSFGPSRPGDLSNRTVSNTAAADALGWTPQIGIEEGMRRTFEWYVANRTDHRMDSAT